MLIKMQHFDVFKEQPMLDFWVNPAFVCTIEPIEDLKYWRIRTAGNDTYVITHVHAQQLIDSQISGQATEQSAAAEVLTPAATLLAAGNGSSAPAGEKPLTLPKVAPGGYNPDSLADFRRMLNTDEYVILDTETTGLDDGEIVQIAILERTGRILLDTLVKPKQPIPPSAFAIHGISDAMVEDSPTWALIQPEVFRLLQGRNVVIYNAVYDRKMMHKSSERWGLPKTEWKEIATFWCAMTHFAEVYGDWNDYRGNYRWQKLESAARYYNIPFQGKAHTALGDCMTTLAVCHALKVDPAPDF
jgi:DNA polymerase III subunit epsilon